MAKEYPTCVTFLDMHAPFPSISELSAPIDWPPMVTFTAAPHIPLATYRHIYDEVGRHWCWFDRQNMTDKKLADTIYAPTTDIFLLRHKQVIIGFVELNFRYMPTAELVFLGLTPPFIGHSLGKKMLFSALAYMKQKHPQRIIIQTCTLDHPRALQLYQKYGFSVYRRKETIVRDAS